MTSTNTCHKTLNIKFNENSFDISPFVCFLLGNSPASEFYMPKFRDTMFHLHRQVGAFCTYLPMKMEQCSETSEYKIQMLGNYTEESIQHFFSSFVPTDKCTELCQYAPRMCVYTELSKKANLSLCVINHHCMKAYTDVVMQPISALHGS